MFLGTNVKILLLYWPYNCSHSSSYINLTLNKNWRSREILHKSRPQKTTYFRAYLKSLQDQWIPHRSGWLVNSVLCQNLIFILRSDYILVTKLYINFHSGGKGRGRYRTNNVWCTETSSFLPPKKKAKRWKKVQGHPGLGAPPLLFPMSFREYTYRTNSLPKRDRPRPATSVHLEREHPDNDPASLQGDSQGGWNPGSPPGSSDKEIDDVRKVGNKRSWRGGVSETSG